ncbi:unnamed protein product [Miscanthus lutarioriparius]|uniref:Ent-kaurene oxidase n=1 Tax=Miscanthus lutarioriparius TaxID=422564 RepID=A0A811S4N8_9POAL|nr:unnamed protein product [Miscanthus lutarioriparius]
MESLVAALPAGGAAAAAAAAAAAVGGLVAAAALAGKAGLAGPKKHLNAPPAVPGLPMIGNLHQLKEKKPHQTFTKWAEIYGPIYTIRTGASSVVVLNSAQVAKEAMIAKFSSISTRKLSKALSVLTHDKTMVATSDYGDFHKMVKRYVMTSMLGTSGQKQFRDTRNMMVDNMLNTFHTLLTDDPNSPLNFREVFKNELFRLSLIQALGEDVSSVYVEEYGKVISKEEIYQATVADMMMCAIETRISYLDFLLAENTLTDEQLLMLVWEAVIEAADTTLVTTEWAMYEIAKHPEKQEYLYQEIQKVCGNKTVTEDHLPELPYLNAVFHETLRRHSPVPLVPPRFVHENTNLAGYEVLAGTEMIINLYGCNMNKSDWADPEEWKPERFLDGRFEAADLYKTMAFGAGRRACAGSMQAVNISCTAIARFVQEFAWRLKEGDEDKADTIQLTTNRLYPLHVYLTPRGRK